MSYAKPGMDYTEKAWHVYWNGGHVLGPVTYLEAMEKHCTGPNDSRIVRGEGA